MTHKQSTQQNQNQNGSIACYRCNRICHRLSDVRAGGIFVRGVFCPGGLLSGGLMPVPPKFNAYTHRLGFLCLSSQHDRQTKKANNQTNKKTNSALQLRGEQTPAPQIFRVCRGGGTLHISSKHYMGPTPFYRTRAKKTPQKADFAMKQTNICRLSGDIINQHILQYTSDMCSGQKCLGQIYPRQHLEFKYQIYSISPK